MAANPPATVDLDNIAGLLADAWNHPDGLHVVNTPSRLFVRCGACQARSAIVVGRDGHEVRECSSCGRRRALRHEVNRKLLATAPA